MPQLRLGTSVDMVDTEDMVDTVDTMAASADPLKLKLPQLHTMVVMVDTEDMVDTVDTMVASADVPNHLHTMDMVDMAMEATVMAKGPLRLMLSLAT